MPPQYDGLLDMAFATTDFLIGALTLPIRLLIPNVPGVKSLSAGTLGSKLWGGSKQGGTEGRLESYHIWVWVAFLTILVLYL